MKWTPEQARQCRAEFEAKCLAGCKIVLNEDGEYHYDADHIKWLGFQAAWRPRLTKEQIEELLRLYDGITNQARAIHRAMGGEKDE